jgi:hypothetical protein
MRQPQMYDLENMQIICRRLSTITAIIFRKLVGSGGGGGGEAGAAERASSSQTEYNSVNYINMSDIHNHAFVFISLPCISTINIFRCSYTT